MIQLMTCQIQISLAPGTFYGNWVYTFKKIVGTNNVQRNLLKKKEPIIKKIWL